MQLAPILLFVHARLDHTRRTIETLRENLGAKDSDLIICSDGARSEAETLKVDAVRSYLRGVEGFRSVSIHEQERNLGLAASVISGIGAVLAEHDQLIVLEDDLVTSPYFLKFMNEALHLYKDDDRVISIQGYAYPTRQEMPETYFLRGADCWGWATWRRGWSLFNADGKNLLAELRRQSLTGMFDYGKSYGFTDMLEAQVEGKINSWAIRWYASAFLADKLSLYPGKSLVFNIGNDSSGVHSETTSVFDTLLSEEPVRLKQIVVEDCQSARMAIARYFRSSRGPLLRRVVRAFMRRLRSLHG